MKRKEKNGWCESGGVERRGCDGIGMIGVFNICFMLSVVPVG